MQKHFKIKTLLKMIIIATLRRGIWPTAFVRQDAGGVEVGGDPGRLEAGWTTVTEVTWEAAALKKFCMCQALSQALYVHYFIHFLQTTTL